MVQDRWSGGCVPGGEGPQGAETWSCSHCGELLLYIAVAGIVCAIGSLSLPQVQYQMIFEAVLVFLDTFETYANFQK